MALTNEREKRICAKYSAYDENRRVHCFECPLNYIYYKSMEQMECKAIMHYDRHKRERVSDERVDLSR